MAQDRTSTAIGLEHESDEILVAAAQRGQTRADEARKELISRYHESLCRSIAHGVRSWVWNKADLEDAHQQTLFWIHDAIDHYKSGACGFRTFLGCLVANRLKDLRKHLSRHESRCDHSILLEEVPSSGRTNPAVTAMDRELWQRLDQAVAGLTERERLVYFAMVERATLAETADRLDLTWRQAKRLRERVSGYLRVKIGDFIGVKCD